MADTPTVFESILKTIRQHVVGYEENCTAFDPQLIDHTNAALWRLNQLNVGTQGFTITDETQTWGDFMGSDQKNIAMVKQYVQDSVKYYFDPPSNSYHTNAIKDRMEKTECLLNYECDPYYE